MEVSAFQEVHLHPARCQEPHCLRDLSIGGAWGPPTSVTTLSPHPDGLRGFWPHPHLEPVLSSLTVIDLTVYHQDLQEIPPDLVEHRRPFEMAIEPNQPTNPTQPNPPTPLNPSNPPPSNPLRGSASSACPTGPASPPRSRSDRWTGPTRGGTTVG